MGPVTSHAVRLLDLRTLAACVFVLSHVSAQEPICYGNLGVQSDSLFSCQPDSSANTACCAPGDICYSNGLCSPGPTEDQDTATPFFWNGCTDPTFKAPECFSACYNLQGNGVQVCENAGPNHYCCYQFGGCNCSDPSQVFSVAAATILTTIDPGITHTPQTSSTSSSAKPTSNSAVTTSSSASSSSATSSPSQSAPTSAPTAANADATTQNSSTSGKQVSIAVPVGVGVGVGVPLILIIVGLVVYILRRRPAVAAPPPPADDMKPFHSTELSGYYNPRVELAGNSSNEYSAGAYSPNDYPR